MIRTTLSRFHAQTTPRGRGMFVLLAVVLLIALATGEVVLYHLSYFLMVAIALCYAWAWLNLRRLDMRVEDQDLVAQVGGFLNGSITVHNRSRLRTGWVEIAQISDMPGHVCEGATQLPARGWEQWKTEVLCYARGVYTVGPLVARSSDPLGLFRVKITRTTPVTVIIYPRVAELPGFRLPEADLSGERSALLHLRAHSAQASTARQYTHGDSLSRIHWPSTARCGQLMSKEFDSGKSNDVWIILDLQRVVHKTAGMDRSDEYAVAIAASLASRALSEDCSVGLIAYGDREYLLPPHGGTPQMSRVLETLALSRTEGETPLDEVLVKDAQKLGRLASLFVVTSSTDTAWVSELRDLMSRGLSIATVLIDPMSFGGEQSCHDAGMRLISAGILTYTIRRGDDISSALSWPMTPADVSEFGPSSEVSLADIPDHSEVRV
ncbi:MAG: DUF58 domain-containing protein [Dehalococcoidia bacterium]